MPTFIEHPTDLVIHGFAVRTTPERAVADLPLHWQTFLARGGLAQIAGSTGEIYAVYCDYESDWRGAYTMVLGGAVPCGSTVPAGLRRVRVPAGQHAVFAAAGDPAQVIWSTWQQINSSLASSRRYIADYERYLDVGPAGVTAEIVVGLA